MYPAKQSFFIRNIGVHREELSVPFDWAARYKASKLCRKMLYGTRNCREKPTFSATCLGSSSVFM